MPITWTKKFDVTDNGSVLTGVQLGTLQDDVSTGLDANVPAKATTVEAVAGVLDTVYMTPLKTKEAVFRVAWTDCSSTSTTAVLGWSTLTTNSMYYQRTGDAITVAFVLSGTSNATTLAYTLPVAASATLDFYGVVQGIDAGGTPGACSMVLTAGSSTANIYKDMATTAWSTTGTKTVRGQFTYMASA